MSQDSCRTAAGKVGRHPCTAYMKEVMRMFKETMNFAKASTQAARRGWLGD